MRRTLLIPTALVIAGLALAGCSAGSTVSQQSDGSDGGAPQAQPFVAGSNPDTVKSEDVQSSSGQSGTVQSADRQVVETGYATIVVDKPPAAAGDAVRITEQAGGRVDGRNEFAPTKGNQGSATLTLRIPVSALDATLDKLKALGTVQEVSLSSSDVTMQSQDLDARIKALSASVDRLVGLLSAASDTDTLIKLETAISDRQGELESLESQQRYLADQVAMSTLTLNLVSPDQAVVSNPDNFFSGLIAGWAAFVAFFAGLLVVLGVLLPWLVLAAIIVTVIVVLVRRTRRREEAAAEAAARPTVDPGLTPAATAATPTGVTKARKSPTAK